MYSDTTRYSDDRAGGIYLDDESIDENGRMRKLRAAADFYEALKELTGIGTPCG